MRVPTPSECQETGGAEVNPDTGAFAGITGGDTLVWVRSYTGLRSEG